MADEVEVINDDYDNDDVAVMDEELVMSERDKFLFENLVRTINAHKKANSNSNPPPKYPHAKPYPDILENKSGDVI